MKILICIFISGFYVVYVSGQPNEDCRCWFGYESNAERTKCNGIYLQHIMPCNVTEPPKCVCTEESTSIMKDKLGIWCVLFKAGKLIKQWACENKKEWKEFYAKNPDRKPQFAKPSSTCKCWDGYKVNVDGTECQGILVRPVMPCNEPEPPQCKCNQNATDILNEDTGLWCRTFTKGAEIKRWKCENQDEWAKFFEKHPNYKF
ncbi:hypothetical protein FQA39_LY17090 [Lamprigera yunnana]|nr:hypothetical protein FQA39_LY17090 [Lamprigera yunnana]